MSELTMFNCKYISKTGSLEVKTFEAKSEQEVQEKIRSAGGTPVSISSDDKGAKGKSSLNIEINGKVKSKHLALFCRQLHTMLHAGMPLTKSLEVMQEQLKHPKLRAATEDMMNGVQKGHMFSTVMKKHRDVFPELLISMVETGELTGRQDDVLEKMAIHYQKDDKIENKIKGAMVYPIFLSALTVVVVIIMLTKILPTFVKIFEDSGTELPGITVFVMGLSSGILRFWYIILGVIFAVVFGFKAFLKTKDGKMMWDRFLLKLPGIKGPISKIATSRFTRTLSTLLSSGLPLLQSLQMAGKVTRNSVVEQGINELTDDIKKGSKLSVLIRKMDVFPPMLISMVSIGEEAGSLEQMLEKTSDYYDEELEAALTKMVNLVEPIMILIMGIIVGIIVVAMMLPMLTLFKAFQNKG